MWFQCHIVLVNCVVCCPTHDLVKIAAWGEQGNPQSRSQYDKTDLNIKPLINFHLTISTSSLLSTPVCVCVGVCPSLYFCSYF